MMKLRQFKLQSITFFFCLLIALLTDGKIGSLEEKQDLANMGVLYLCNFVGGKKIKMPQGLEDGLKPSGRSRASITVPDAPSPMGLKSLSEMIEGGGLPRTASEPVTDALPQGIIDAREDLARTTEKLILVRFNSAIARC